MEKQIDSFVGRTLIRGSYYVGAAYDADYALFYTIYAFKYYTEYGQLLGKNSDFEVLASDCCSEQRCKEPNKAECCYDLL